MYGLPFLLLYRLHRAAIDARRKHRTWRYLAWSAVAAVTTSILLVVSALAVFVLVRAGLWWLALLFAGFAVLPIAGAALIRHVLVPSGAYRAAYYTGLVSRPGKDPRAYAMCVAAWAHACARPGKGGDGEVWITARRDARIPLGDAEVAVTGLLAAARGEFDSARALLRSVHMLAEDHPAVRELCGEWLACDAAERGAWRELADDAYAVTWPPTPLTYFLEGVATRKIGAAGAPSTRELWARWLLAPHRRSTAALRDDARLPAPEPRDPAAPGEPQDPAPREASDRASLPRAIAAHLALGQRTLPTPVTLGLTVAAWDAALTDDATHAWLAHRALELDAPLGAVDRALRELAAAVTDELARIAETAQLGAPSSRGPIGEALGRRLRHGRLDAVEAGFNAWAARKADYTHGRSASAARAPIDEWREFIALRAAYTAAVTAGGLELRRLAFPHAFTTGSTMAAWLWNEFKEYSMSHAISRWLLDEALVVGDAEAIELGHRNCGLHVRTRLDDA